MKFLQEVVVDELDTRILHELRSDGRLTMADLGRRVGLSRTAALARVQRLERDGTIRGYHADVVLPDDPRRHRARVGVTIATGDTARYVRRLDRLPAYRSADAVAGSFDLLVLLEAPTAADLDGALDEIKGWTSTTSTTTFVVLRTYD